LTQGFRIGDWRVEVHANRLVRADHPEHVVRIEPKAMQVLVHLAQHAGEVVLKESVVREVWEGAFVTDEVLTNAIWELRKALGDDPKNPQFIETIPRKGYRLVAPVAPLDGEDGARPATPIGSGAANRQTRLLWILVAVMSLLAVSFIWNTRKAKAPGPVARFRIDVREPLAALYLPVAAMSPDASRLVYVSDTGGGTQLYLRSIDQIEASPIPGTEGGHGPFFSPDGEWLGFYLQGQLKKVRLGDGSPPLALCDVGSPRGATWGPDDKIYFTPGSSGGILRIAADGGEPEVVTELAEGEWTHRWPDVLPSGSAVVFTVGDAGIVSGFDEAKIVVQSLESAERRVLIEGGSFARYARGHLIYSREGALLALPFDPERLEATGVPVAVLEWVKWFPINGAAQFTLSHDGSLAYVPGDGQWEEPRRLVWVDRQGNAVPLTDDARLFYDPALSPDGQKLAVSIAHRGNSDLWVYDLERDTLTRLTSTGGEEEGPIWTPDGKRVTYYYSMAGPFQMLWMPVDGSSKPERILEAKFSQRPESWSPDGRLLVFSEQNPTTGFDLWLLDLQEDGEPKPLLDTPFHERHAKISPDGRWMAYVSNESGRDEVYARPFPEPGGRWQISSDGGDNPTWSPDGRKLFYRDGDTMMVVHVGVEPEFSASIPELLFEWRYPSRVFEGQYRRHYDVAPDGNRFVMIQGQEAATSRKLHVVLNWIDELAREELSARH
jgi:serine/threonine-protein kinase